jgi:hypothetical protein
MEVIKKLFPVRVKVKSGLPAMIDAGFIEDRVGTGLLTGIGLITIKALLVPVSVPPVLVAVIVKFPPVEIATL